MLYSNSQLERQHGEEQETGRRKRGEHRHHSDLNTEEILALDKLLDSS